MKYQRMTLARSDTDDQDDTHSTLADAAPFLNTSGRRRRLCRLSVLQEHDRKFSHAGESEDDQEILAQASMRISRESASTAQKIGALQAIKKCDR